MTRDTLMAILGELPATRREHDCFVLEAGHEGTVFVASTGGLLPVGKVQRIEVRKELLVLDTLKWERYYFDCADVVGLKIELPEPGKAGHGAGFR